VGEACYIDPSRGRQRGYLRAETSEPTEALGLNRDTINAGLSRPFTVVASTSGGPPGPLPSAVSVNFHIPTIESLESCSDTTKSEAEPNSAPLQDCGETTAPALCPRLRHWGCLRTVTCAVSASRIRNSALSCNQVLTAYASVVEDFERS
jgi:hypothetical protein